MKYFTQTHLCIEGFDLSKEHLWKVTLLTLAIRDPAAAIASLIATAFVFGTLIVIRAVIRKFLPQPN